MAVCSEPSDCTPLCGVILITRFFSVPFSGRVQSHMNGTALCDLWSVGVHVEQSERKQPV